MSSGSSEELAVRKLQEADLWTDGFHKAVKKYRCLALCYLAHIRCLNMAIERNYPSSVILSIVKGRDLAHDMMLTISDDIDSLERSALSCEMASQIYFEEIEQRHWDE